MNEPGAWKTFPRFKVNFLEGFGTKEQRCCNSCAVTDAALAGKIDHTCLEPQATESDIQKLCEEALEHGFAAVCVNPSYVHLASRLLKGSKVRVCAVAGFPLGAVPASVKVFETRQAIAEGADEIDMVINIGALKSKAYALVSQEIMTVREAARGKILKVIVEAALLTKEELVRVSLYSKEAGADFVKTGTGFSSRGASVEDVRIIRETVCPTVGIKAAGGIKSYNFAKELIEAGADRIGTSSSIELMDQFYSESKRR